MLQIDDLVFNAWGRRFFDHASVLVPANAKVGLVGRNGVGKSTLFKLILGELTADGGDISLPKRRAHRQRGPGAPGHPGQPARHHPGRRRAAGRPAHRTGDRRTRTHRRHLRAAGWRSTPTEPPPAPGKSWPAWVFPPPICRARWRNSPAAGACAWPWPPRCSPNPTCCCWTNPPTTSTSKARCGWRRDCASTPTPRSSSATTGSC